MGRTILTISFSTISTLLANTDTIDRTNHSWSWEEAAERTFRPKVHRSQWFLFFVRFVSPRGFYIRQREINFTVFWYFLRARDHSSICSHALHQFARSKNHKSLLFWKWKEIDFREYWKHIRISTITRRSERKYRDQSVKKTIRMFSVAFPTINSWLERNE